MKLLLIVAAAMLATASPAAAYTLDPIARVFTPSGSSASQSFELTNSSSERVAVMISFTTLERDADYNETNRPADDEFLVYPAQILLAPNGKQTVRVTWLGTPTPATELAYRIVVQQVPIELLDKTSPPTPTGQLKVLVTYRGSIYIRPAKATSNISLEGATVVEEAGKKFIDVTLRNRGTAVGLVKSCALHLETPTTKLDVPAATVVTNTKILARNTRRYRLAWPAELQAGALKVSGKCTALTP